MFNPQNTIMFTINTVMTNLLGLFYPNICVICNENLNGNEQHICLNCLTEIPRTNFHLKPDNPVEKRFWGKVNIQKATSFFFFTKGSPFQTLLHELKYHNNTAIGRYMGKMAATELLNAGWLADIDLIVPIPLHPKKLQKRGYNQSMEICKGMSEVFQTPIDEKCLIRTVANSTQTKKNVYQRYENTSGIFSVTNAAFFDNKHILLVDDVLTTGSTLEAAAACILEQNKATRISVFTLALA